MDAQPLLFGFAAGFILLAFVSMTSFVKISVVLLILRQALGMQQVPSNMIVMAIAIFASLFITWPLLNQAIANIIAVEFTEISPIVVQNLWEAAVTPFRNFMSLRIEPEQAENLVLLANDLWADSGIEAATTDFIIQVPSFLITEITSAFKIGFLLYLPFIAIDLAVTGILMALGMQMVQPNILAVPFKLLVFVFVDGWTNIIEGLVLTYSG